MKNNIEQYKKQYPSHNYFWDRVDEFPETGNYESLFKDLKSMYSTNRFKIPFDECFADYAAAENLESFRRGLYREVENVKVSPLTPHLEIALKDIKAVVDFHEPEPFGCGSYICRIDLGDKMEEEEYVATNIVDAAEQLEVYFPKYIAKGALTVSQSVTQG